MDGASVRIILTAIAENNPSQIQGDEVEQAVAWIKNGVWMTPRDKGTEPQHNPEMEEAARAAESAATHYKRGEFDAAKAFAQEALKMLGG